MKAVDTNVLIYAEIHSSPQHEEARRLLGELAEGPLPWAIPWPCIYEFLRIVTHPRVYHPPVPLSVALHDGNLVHDAHIAALCLEHGITELISGDRDFMRFPSLNVRNPFA